MVHQRKRHLLAGILSVVALSLLLTATGVAAGDTTSATVQAGTLDISVITVGSFTGRSVTGAAQTTTAALEAFKVSNLTGSGGGWHVTAKATQFVGATHDLGPGSLSMSAPSVTADGTDSPAPTVEPGPYTIDSGSAVEIASAAVNEGMGVYDFGATTLTLSLPSDVYADTYTSTVTIDVISAP